MLVEVSLNDDLLTQMTTIEFKEKLSKLQVSMNAEDNEFKTVGNE